MCGHLWQTAAQQVLGGVACQCLGRRRSRPVLDPIHSVDPTQSTLCWIHTVSDRSAPVPAPPAGTRRSGVPSACARRLRLRQVPPCQAPAPVRGRPCARVRAPAPYARAKRLHLRLRQVPGGVACQAEGG
eukprot:365251-Chlamydomonas_euryale.AAC.11